MAYDIGPRIGIDGEAEFRKQLRTVSESIKTLGSEMKVVTTAFAGNEDSMEALTAKNEVLSKTIEALNDEIKQQRKFLDDSKDKFGDNAEETQKWQRAVNESTAELNRLQNELRENERKLENFGQEAEDAGNSMENAGEAALDFGDALKASFVGNLAVEGIKALGSALMELGSSIVNLDEETREYRTQQGMLRSAFKSNKMDADAARKAYEGLYKVIGDSGQATEAAQLLSNLARSSEDIDFWVNTAAGSWTKFGEALPINNLIEAANEAVKTGESVSALDDAINWSGGNAEEFGEKLAAAASEEARLAIITETLNKYLGDSADAFYENNEQIVKERENALLLEEVMGKLGEAVADVKGKIGEELNPVIGELGEAFADLLSGTEGAEQKFSNAISKMLDVAIAKGPEFTKAGIDFVFALLEGLLSDPEKLSDAMFSLVNTLIDSLIDHAPELAAQGTLLALELLRGFLDNYINWWDIAGEFTQSITSAFEERKSEFGDVGSRLWQSLFGAFGDAIESAKEKWRNFLDFFGGFDKYDISWGPSIKATPHKTGLNYVPYDGYLAELHKGEMVLTARQAEMMRSTGVTNGSMQDTGAALINAMQTMGNTGFGDSPVNITLVMPDGDEFATWQLPSLIRVASAQGTPIIAER